MLICDVCGQNEAVGVASSSFGAVSHAYCSICLKMPAEPLYIFYHLYDDVSNDGEGLHDSVKQWCTWYKGRYISWDKFVEIAKLRSAHDWLKLYDYYGYTILDPDGWRRNDGVTMDTPITRADFRERLAECTITFDNPESGLFSEVDVI